MKAWGSDSQKVVAKNFEVMFNAGRSEELVPLQQEAGGTPCRNGAGVMTLKSSS